MMNVIITKGMALVSRTARTRMGHTTATAHLAMCWSLITTTALVISEIATTSHCIHCVFPAILSPHTPHAHICTCTSICTHPHAVLHNTPCTQDTHATALCMPRPYDYIRLCLLGPPSELVLVAFNSTALRAGWLPPTVDPNDGTLLYYGAVCSSAIPEGSGVQYTLDIEEARGTLLTALSPYTHYHCCVWVVTSKASGPSICQSTRTYEDGTFSSFTSAVVLFTMPPLLALCVSQFPTVLQKASPQSPATQRSLMCSGALHYYPTVPSQGTTCTWSCWMEAQQRGRRWWMPRCSPLAILSHIKLLE